MKLYDVIYADPAWPFDKPRAVIGNGGKGRINAENTTQVDITKQYPTMSLDEIKALPVPELSAKNSLLFLWTTNNHIREAYEVVEHWSFKPQNFLTYGKVCKSDSSRVHGSVGWWYRSATEHLIFAIKGKVKRPKDFYFNTLLLDVRYGHSVKPNSYYDMIEKAFPGGRYLELFARNQRVGWDQWGNEINESINLNDYNIK